MLRLEGLVPPMFALSAALVQDNAEVEARDILLQLLDIAETEPRLFRKEFSSHLTMLLALMRGRVGEGEELDMETRLAALEVVVTLVEKRPAFVRKDEPQLRAVITGMMELLLELEVTEEWHTAIEEEELDNGEHPLTCPCQSRESCGVHGCSKTNCDHNLVAERVVPACQGWHTFPLQVWLAVGLFQWGSAITA